MPRGVVPDGFGDGFSESNEKTPSSKTGTLELEAGLALWVAGPDPKGGATSVDVLPASTLTCGQTMATATATTRRTGERRTPLDFIFPE